MMEVMKALEEWPVAGRVICQGDGDLAPSQIPLSQWLDYCMYYINRNAQEMQQKQHTCTRVYVYTVQVVHNERSINTHLPNLKVVRNTQNVKKSFCWLSQLVVKDNFSRIFKIFVCCFFSDFSYILYISLNWWIFDPVICFDKKYIRPNVMCRCKLSCHVDKSATFSLFTLNELKNSTQPRYFMNIWASYIEKTYFFFY